MTHKIIDDEVTNLHMDHIKRFMSIEEEKALLDEILVSKIRRKM
jgi:hypothetical protein